MTPPPDPLEGLVAAALSDARAIGIVEPQAGPDGEPYELIGLYTPGMRAVLHRLAHAARQQGIEEEGR